MLIELERKLRQMYAALGGVRDEDISSVTAQTVETPEMAAVSIDFNANSDSIELHNRATLLVSNIACLKDHLRAWCKANTLPFKGDDLIDSNRAVAIIHDLWNVDKHLELNRPPRSGHKPKLQNLRTALELSTGRVVGSRILVTFDAATGKPIVKSSGEASASIVLSAAIVDETGSHLGEFLTICTKAADAWEAELRDAGVPLPAR